MASKSLGTLTLDLVAKIGGFTGPMDKASREAKKFAADVDKAGKVIGTGIAVGVTAATAALAYMVKTQLEVIGNQDDMATRLHTSVESLGTLTRAAELSGVALEQIEKAGLKLDIALVKAAEGSKSQTRALDRLGLSYEELSKLELDKKIVTINTALANNIPIAERAAVAAELFGSKNATAIQMLNADVIAEAAHQIQVFGVMLSDVDSAKVEMAGDALSNFGLLSDGIAKQLTVELAPALKAIGDQFLESAEDAGGIGSVVQDAVRVAVSALAFLIDAGDGVSRVFRIAADRGIDVFATRLHYATAAIAELVNAVDAIPGIDLTSQVQSLRNFSREQQSVAAQARDGIRSALDTPLAGTAFKEFYNQAQKAGQAAAESAVAAKKSAVTGQQSAAAYTAALEGQESAAKAAAKSEKEREAAALRVFEAAQTQVEALQLQVAVLGKGASEAKLYELALNGATEAQIDMARAALEALDAFKQQEDYKSLVSDLRTDEEKLTDQMRQRLSVLDAIHSISEDERSKSTARIIDDSFAEAPKFGGLDASVGGAGGELDKINDAEKELEKWYETQLEMLDKSRSERADLNAEWDEKELELKKEHEDKLLGLERARTRGTLAAGEEFFGNMAALSQSGNKKLGQIGKAAAIAQATISGVTAVVNALAIPPYPLGLALSISAGVLAAANVAQIAGVQFKTGGYTGDAGVNDVAGVVHGQEFVMNAAATARIGRANLEAMQRGKVDRAVTSIRDPGAEGRLGSAARSSIVNQTIQVSGRVDNRTANQIARSSARRQRQAQAKFG